MTARDVLETNIDPAVPADMARRSIDDFAAEVLHEGAAVLEAIADEAEARVAAHYGPASGIGPGSAEMVREDARTLRALAAERYGRVTAEGATDFFQVGRTYRLGQRHTFRCTSVDVNPGTGEQHAIGWGYDTHTTRWRVTDLTSFNWGGGWTEVTEPGQAPVLEHYDKVPDPADGCHWCACGNRWPCKDATAVTA